MSVLLSDSGISGCCRRHAFHHAGAQRDARRGGRRRLVVFGERVFGVMVAIDLHVDAAIAEGVRTPRAAA
jgi:hypothetical protein